VALVLLTAGEAKAAAHPTAVEKVAAEKVAAVEVRAAAGIDRETARNWNKE
jgi:hypothetical protein